MRDPSSRRTRSRQFGPGVLFGVVVAAAASLMLLRANEPIACEDPVPLKIVAAPSITGTVEEIVRRDVDAGCTRIRVVAQGSADAARAIASGGSDLPALWIPDSAMWPRRAEQLAASSSFEPPSIDPGQPLATSPLVVVTSRTHGAQLGWPETRVGWQDLMSGSLDGLPTTIGDPLSTTEGLTTLTAVRGLLGGAEGTPGPELVGAMLQIGRDAAPSIRSAYERLGTAGRPPAFTASEQSVVAHNRSSTDTPVVAVYPREGTVTLEYPLARVIAPGEPAAVAGVIERIGRALRSPAATSTLMAAGFRSPDGRLDQAIDATLGVVPSKPVPLPSPSVEQAAEVLRTWSAVTLDSRMLVVIDVSGSMDAGAGNGQSRIELARDASLAALGLFPDRTEIGLWAFSIAKDPPDDWIELVPTGPLSASVGRGIRRQAMLDAARSLPSRTGGGTALNDTALAAFRAARAGYQPGKVNSVVLMTDGRNEDRDSIDTDELIKILRDEADPSTPVPIIAIGLGPDVDVEALQQIAAATGGKAYLTRDPADIRRVFLDALIQRQCRPNC